MFDSLTPALTALPAAALETLRAQAWICGDWERARDVILEQMRREWNEAVRGLHACSGPRTTVSPTPQLPADATPWEQLTADLSGVPESLARNARLQYPDINEAALASRLGALLPANASQLLAALN